MTGARLPDRIAGISFDLGNTLYALRPQEMSETVRSLHRFLERRLGRTLPFDTLDRLYVEIRDRQFAENRATLCENDFDERLRLMIAHVHEPPDATLVAEAKKAYAKGFVSALTLGPAVGDTVKRVADLFDGQVVVCSNFIASEAIREVLERDGLMRHLKLAVVSCDIGFVKPHPSMFQAVCDALQLAPDQIAHVGDDLDADIVGGRRAGMTTVYTTEYCSPASPDPVAAAAPDFTISSLPALLQLVPPSRFAH